MAEWQSLNRSERFNKYSPVFNTGYSKWQSYIQTQSRDITYSTTAFAPFPNVESFISNKVLDEEPVSWAKNPTLTQNVHSKITIKEWSGTDAPLVYVSRSSLTKVSESNNIGAPPHHREHGNDWLGYRISIERNSVFIRQKRITGRSTGGFDAHYEINHKITFAIEWIRVIEGGQYLNLEGN